MKVKPAVLDLFEKHLIPLGPDLLPCLKSLLIALLPGLEEEGNNDFFSRVFTLFIRLEGLVGSQHFYKAMWMCLLYAPNMRIAAVHFFLKVLSSKVTKEKPALDPSEFDIITGGDSFLVSKAMAATLLDSKLLVSRGMLELIVTYFPLNNK